MSEPIVYTLTKETLTLSNIKEKYGEISFAYASKTDDAFDIIAIANCEPQYLNVALLKNKILFRGVKTTIELDYFSGVL